MLDLTLADSHDVRRVAQPVLNFLQYGFMLPSPNSPLLARCALRFQHTSLAIRTQVTVQLQAFFNAGKAPDQRISSGTNVFLFCRVIDEGIVIETPVSRNRPVKSSTQPRKAETWCALKFKWAPVLDF